MLYLEPASSPSHILRSHGRGHISPDILSVIVMPFHQGSHIKLGLLNDLDLTNVTILDGENGRCLPLNLLSGRSGNECLNQGLEITLARQTAHGSHHLGTDLLHFGRLGVTGLLQLIVLLLREGDAEHTHDVSVGGTTVDVGLDDALLLLDERA